MQLTRQQSPEDRELQSKRSTLAALESDLAAKELDLATLHATLHAFEKKYLAIVGTRYAEPKARLNSPKTIRDSLVAHSLQGIAYWSK